MKIGGIQKNSFVDYPGRMSMVVFTQGCNMDCYYCHNKVLCTTKNPDLIKPDEVLDILENRKGFIDGVVISGGEPTLQEGLEEFVTKVKNMGYKVKLDTNGTNTQKVKNLIDKGLIDYVAMDIKAPIKSYKTVCNALVPSDEIESTVDLLMKNQIDYEFRTTFVPELSKDDIINIACRIKGAKKYSLQQYRPPSRHEMVQKPHPDEYIKDVQNLVSKYVTQCEVRGIG